MESRDNQGMTKRRETGHKEYKSRRAERQRKKAK